MEEINKTIDNTPWPGCGERENTHSLFMGMRMGAATLEISMENPQEKIKVKTNLPYDPDIPPLHIRPEDSHPTHRYLLSHVHCCPSHHS